MTAPKLKLTYFDGTGRAELIRLLFAFGGVAFDDKRIAHADMPALKPSLPLGQVPTLEVDGVVYSQSMAIARYAAKIAGLYPTDITAALRVDMISETLRDIIAAFVGIYAEQDAAKKAELTSKFLDETVPSTLRVLENMVQGAFFRGDTASLADVHLFDLVHNALVPVFQFSLTPTYPKLAAVVHSVQTHERIAAYLARTAATKST